MLSLDIKEEKVRLPHYTEHPEYNQWAKQNFASSNAKLGILTM
jgi:hypothetical protein